MSVGDFRAVVERAVLIMRTVIDGTGDYHFDLTDDGTVQFGLAPMDMAGMHDAEVWISGITPRSSEDGPRASLGKYARHVSFDIWGLVKGGSIEERTLNALDLYQDIQKALEIDSVPSTGASQAYQVVISDAAVIPPELIDAEALGEVSFTVSYVWATDLGAITGTS